MRAASDRVLLVAGALLGAVFAPSGTGAAQEHLRITGIVRDGAGAPLADVGLLVGGTHHARSDASGRFQFDSLTPGLHSLRIRRLGFMPMVMRVDLTGGRDTTLDVMLVPRPRVLETIVVKGDCPRMNFDGFLCRRRSGSGVFLTEQDILAKNPRHLADIFLGMKDFHVDVQMTPHGAARVVQTTQSRCLVTLVDGRPPVTRGLYIDSSSTAGGTSDREYTEGNFYGPQNLIGVEIYPPGHEVPKEYAHLTRATPSRGGRIRGSGNRPNLRRVEPVKESCVLINYWTPAGIKKR